MEKAFITEFIELYKNRPCLWDKRVPSHTNKNMRHDALRDLLKVMQKQDPSANIASVRCKIDNLRSNYKRERKKVINSEISGCSGNDIHRPILWYYKLMAFIDTDSEGQSSGTRSGGNSLSNDNDITLRLRLPTKDSQNSEIAPPAPKRQCTGKISIKKVIPQVEKSSNVIDSSDDEFDSFGKMAAKTLRKLSNPYQSVALKLMSDVLFQAKMGLINVDSIISTPASHNSDSRTPNNTYSTEDTCYTEEIKYIPRGSMSPTDPLSDDTEPERHSQNILSQILTNQIKYP